MVIPYKKYIDLKDVIYKIILNIHVYAYIYIRLFTWNQEVKQSQEYTKLVFSVQFYIYTRLLGPIFYLNREHVL